MNPFSTLWFYLDTRSAALHVILYLETSFELSFALFVCTLIIKIRGW